jgi:hypothetical protein
MQIGYEKIDELKGKALPEIIRETEQLMKQTFSVKYIGKF